MSSHIFSDEQLIAFAFGELNIAESDRVASHVAECDQCHATVASVQGIRMLLREDDSAAAPLATLARAQAIFRQHTFISQPGWFERIRRGPLQRARPLAVVSSLATLALTLALLYASARLVAPAVQATVPGDTLYPVKTTAEDVRVVVALDNSAKVQAQLSIAQARVTEINTLVAQGRYDLLPETTNDYQRHVQQATTTLGQVLKQDPGQVALAQKAEQDLARYEVSLAVLQENSPGDVKPQIRQAVIASTAAKSTVQHQLSDIARPSSATPTPLVTPTPNVVVTASSAPALPAATNTSAPAPTGVITPPGAVTTLPTVVNSPTAPPASSSIPTSSASPTASLPAPTKTTIPVTSTVLPTSTPVAPTGTRPTTMTPAPTSTPGSTATTPAATSAPTKTLPLATTTATPAGATLPIPASSLGTPTLVPTPASAPSSASQTATPIALTPTPAAAPAIGPTSTIPAMPTSTLSINNSGISPSSTGTPLSDPTSVPAGPSASIAPIGIPAAPVGATPFAATPNASSVATLTAPTPIGAGGTSAPSAGSSSTDGTKPLPSTPGPNVGSAASSSTPATGGGATSTSIAPAGAPGASNGPTVAATSSGVSSPPIAPIATVGPPVQAAPTTVPSLKVATPTAGLVTDLVPPGIIIPTR